MSDPDLRDVMDLLSRVPGFERSSEAQLQALAAHLRVEEVTGRTFIVEGEPAPAVWFLLEGQVEVSCATPQGERVVVGVLEPPAIVGFAGLLDARSRVASVRARGRVRVLRMDGAVARELLLRDDELSALLRRGLLIALSSQLARANQLLARLSTSAQARAERSGPTMVV